MKRKVSLKEQNVLTRIISKFYVNVGIVDIIKSQEMLVIFYSVKVMDS